jgi:hypothetical protein
MPDRKWLEEVSARVVRSLDKYRRDRCPLPAWPNGPQCALPAGHVGQRCINTGPFEQPDKLFDGPIPSNSRKDLAYHVTIWRVGQRGECTCPAFTQFHKGRDCSHITTVRAALRGG